MKAKEIVEAVMRHHGCHRQSTLGPPEWAGISEMTLRPGGGGSRIDLFLVRGWSGKPAGHERRAVEVKVSRTDLRKELAHPEKREPWMAVAHRFYFATPPDLIKDGELPDGCGLIEADPDGSVKVKVKAPRRDVGPIPERMAVEALRRAGTAEVRGWFKTGPDRTVAQAEAAAADARRVATAARTRLESRNAWAANLWALCAPLLDGMTCVCGCPVRAGRQPGARGRVNWSHDGEPGEIYGRPCRWPVPDQTAWLDAHDLMEEIA